VRGEHPFNPASRSQDLRGGPLYEPSHLVIGAVPAADLDKPVSRPHVVTIRPSRHIAVEQRICQQRVRWRELRRQLSAKIPNISLNLGTRVIGHQADDLSIDTLTAKITSAIQWVETRLHQLGRVADVV
jgi:hypothetical protein